MINFYYYFKIYRILNPQKLSNSLKVTGKSLKSLRLMFLGNVSIGGWNKLSAFTAALPKLIIFYLEI